VHDGFDPLSPELLEDPYAVLAELPADEPVFYAPSLDYYVVTRYADVESVFLDPKTYSAATAQLPLVKLEPEALKILAEGGHRPQPSMVSLDPPAHTRLRRPTSRAFTPRRVAAMEDRIRATVDELLDAVDDSRPFDLVSSLTFPLPATIVFSFILRGRQHGQARRAARARGADRPLELWASAA
jgi:cytochrome P450